MDEWEVSPFQSIPHAFWWALVTISTVGYGDMFPTTSSGYFVGSLTMVFSLVIMALPVGVIGGTFTKVWDDFEEEKQRQADALKREKSYMTLARQRINPAALTKVVLVEVW